MTDIELRNGFFELQKEFTPFKDFLIENQFKELYKDFRGFDASPSKLIFQPKVLFLGYNPTGSKDWQLLEHHPHLPLEPHLNEERLMFFQWNSARKGADWFQLDKQPNNSLPRQIVDLLYNLVSLCHPERNNEKGTNKEPYWSKEFENQMMFLNLYPIATKDGKTMVSLFKKICKEDSFTKKFKNEWQLRMFFIGIMHRMIKLIDPNLIICMGAQTFHDYTYSIRQKHSIKEIFTSPKYDNIIGFSRKGSWEGNIPNLAQEIYKRAF